MKKSAAFILCFVLALRAFPQCVPDFSISAVGFYPPDSLLPCAEQGIYYDEVLQFKNFDIVFFPPLGIYVTIISVRIDSVRNMPPGLSYECNSPNCFYLGDENGCVRISGTTTAPAGTYNLGFYASLIVDIGTGPIPFPADSQLLASNGLGYSITVISQGGFCPNKHTGQLYFNATVIDPAPCEGDTVPFHTLVSDGTPPYAYSWSPGGNLSNPSSPNPVLYPTHPGIYGVTVTDANNRTATDSVEVVYFSNPGVVAGPDTLVCPGSTLQLEASGGITYTWSPAASLSDPYTANPLASPAQTTTYTVTVSNGACTASADVTVSVNTAAPQAAFSIIPIDLTVRFNNISSGASSYHWDFGDGNTSAERNPQHLYSQHATYEVTLIATNDCGISDTVTATVNLTVGKASAHHMNALEVFPNPATGMFQLSSAGFAGHPFSCEILSPCGMVVKAVLLNGEREAIYIDLSSQPKGIYFLKIVSGNAAAYKKIVLQ